MQRFQRENPQSFEPCGSQGSLHYGNAVMIRREPYGGSPSGSTKKTGHRPVGFVELMTRFVFLNPLQLLGFNL